MITPPCSLIGRLNIARVLYIGLQVLEISQACHQVCPGEPSTLPNLGNITHSCHGAYQTFVVCTCSVLWQCKSSIFLHAPQSKIMDVNDVCIFVRCMFYVLWVYALDYHEASRFKKLQVLASINYVDCDSLDVLLARRLQHSWFPRSFCPALITATHCRKLLPPGE